MEFLKVWTNHNFYYIRYISVYILSHNNMNRVILWGHRSKRTVFSTHLDTTVQAMVVKSLTPDCCEY